MFPSSGTLFYLHLWERWPVWGRGWGERRILLEAFFGLAVDVGTQCRLRPMALPVLPGTVRKGS